MLINKQLVNLLVCEKKLIAIDVRNDALESLRKRQYSLFVAFIRGMKVEKSKGVYDLSHSWHLSHLKNKLKSIQTCLATSIKNEF